MTDTKKTIITDLVATEILDSRGVPTVEAEITLSGGVKAWAQVPSGSSTGAFEAIELRDGDEKRFFGKGVLQAIHNVNTEIKDTVIGMDATDQRGIDDAMNELDGTENKSRLGANAILSVSLAACRAAAIGKRLPLYKYIAMLHGTAQVKMPIPMFNIINGGKHADSGLAVQEYKVVPRGIKGFAGQYRAGSEIFHALKKNLSDQGYATSVGDEGGFAPRLTSNTAPLTEIAQAVSGAGYAMGKDVMIALDAAANSFYDEECGHYAFQIEKEAYNADKLVDVYDSWVQNNYLMSIEDGLHEDHWADWTKMNERLGKKIMLVGDDLIVTNVKRLQKAIDEKCCNAVLIKPNQIGTLSETLDCIALAQEHDMNTIVSHRSGETIDDFIADLSVGVASPFIKTGSLSRGERLVKYNRLLAISREIEK